MNLEQLVLRTAGSSVLWPPGPSNTTPIGRAWVIVFGREHVRPATDCARCGLGSCGFPSLRCCRPPEEGLELLALALRKPTARSIYRANHPSIMAVAMARQ